MVSQPCPLFVPLAEEGWTDNDVARITWPSTYLAPFRRGRRGYAGPGVHALSAAADTIGEVMGPGRRPGGLGRVGRLGGSGSSLEAKPAPAGFRRRGPGKAPSLLCHRRAGAVPEGGRTLPGPARSSGGADNVSTCE